MSQQGGYLIKSNNKLEDILIDTCKEFSSKSHFWQSRGLQAFTVFYYAMQKYRQGDMHGICLREEDKTHRYSSVDLSSKIKDADVYMRLNLNGRMDKKMIDSKFSMQLVIENSHRFYNYKNEEPQLNGSLSDSENILRVQLNEKEKEITATKMESKNVIYQFMLGAIHREIVDNLIKADPIYAKTLKQIVSNRYAPN